MSKGGGDADPLNDAYERGRAAWPEVTVDAARFAEHAAPFVEGSPLHQDLYLACACVTGDAAALAAFDRRVLSEVDLHIRRIDGAADLVDEVRQTLRERLLVARGGQPPRIAAYSGRGPIGAWVRVAAVRAAIDVMRRRGSEPKLDGNAAARAEAPDVDPEAALLRARYQGEYESALRAALATLTPRDRSLLRMYFVDGMTVERIGVVYRVHRATVSRWIFAARTQLLDETYRLLGERLRLSASEFASLAALVQSRLDLSLSGILKQ
jgi:RNA polymerase sigma-70 factor (ECF subfamily)